MFSDEDGSNLDAVVETPGMSVAQGFLGEEKTGKVGVGSTGGSSQHVEDSLAFLPEPVDRQPFAVLTAVELQQLSAFRVLVPPVQW